MQTQTDSDLLNRPWWLSFQVNSIREKTIKATFYSALPYSLFSPLAAGNGGVLRLCLKQKLNSFLNIFKSFKASK